VSVRFGGVVPEVNVEPDSPRQPENINEKNDAKDNQQSKRSHCAPPQYPMKNSNKGDAEPAHKNVGNKHGAIIKSRLRHEILTTMVATGFHVERALKGERAGVEQVGRVASRTFKLKYAVCFAAF